MKILRILACAFGAAIALAFGASSVKAVSSIGIVTNYSVLNFNITVATNIYKATSSGFTYTISQKKLVTKDVLAILQGVDYYNGPFPPGSKLVIGWDEKWEGAVLVVDKTGTNVLYNCKSGGSSGETALVVNFFYEYGTGSQNKDNNDPGHNDYTYLNSGEFYIYDTTTPQTDDNLDLGTQYNPATITYDLNWDKNGDYTTWSSSSSMTLGGGGQHIDGVTQATISGTITASGHGKGSAFYLN
jgi:hypothetical protein